MKDVSLRIRLKLAWAAFRMKDVNLRYGPYRYQTTLSKGVCCDMRYEDCAKDNGVVPCINAGKVCIGRSGVQFDFDNSEDLHVCMFHARKTGALGLPDIKDEVFVR